MTVSVAIAGATGYAGGELVRLLLGHPEHLAGNLQIGALTGASSAGTPVSVALPHAPELFGRTIEPTDAEHLAGHDVVFLALPHGHSAEIAAQLPEDTAVIDCAADHRLTDAGDWAHWYGGEYSGSWPYGIPEMPGHREALAGATRIALPGCFPTGATLALLPAVAAGLVAPEVAVTSVSGVSGAGKKPLVANLGAETMGSLRAYNTAGRHRHTPEIAQNLGEYSGQPVSVSFTPVLAPLPRGILTVASAPLADSATDTAAARAAYEKFYADEPFVTLLAEGVQPQTQWVLGANTCHVQVEVDAASGRLLATSAIDNLTKGTAGAGVQCMNLALGLPETAGLPTTAVAP